MIGTVIAVSALATYATAVALGTLLAGRLVLPPGRRRLFRLHRAVAVVAVILAGAHVMTVTLGASRLGGGGWTGVGLGITALAGVVLAAASWTLRGRLGRAGPGGGSSLRPPWRRVHVLADAGLAVALVHAVVAHPPGMPHPEAVAYAVGAGIVGWLILRRVRAGTAGRRGSATGPASAA